MENRVRELIRRGEDTELDYKLAITHAGKIARTLVAFANTCGGSLLVGVTDEGKLVGTFPDEERYMLQRAAATLCSPPLHLCFEEIELPDNPRPLLLATIAASPHRPHCCRDRHGQWQAYVRVGAHTVKATEAQMARWHDEAQARTLEKPPTNHEQALFAYLKRRERVTLKDYAKLINVSKRRAAHILTALVSSGDLCHHPRANFYTLAS